MMDHKKLLAALRRLKVQTGSLACLGCRYEHDCGVHGCAILREAEDAGKEIGVDQRARQSSDRRAARSDICRI